MGRHLSLQYGHVILVSGYPILTTTWMSNIRLQTPSLAKKCEISHWLPCEAVGWEDRHTDCHATTKSLGWIGNHIFLDMGLYSGALHVRVVLHYHFVLNRKVLQWNPALQPLL